jgi:hypothetical protein
LKGFAARKKLWVLEQNRKMRELRPRWLVTLSESCAVKYLVRVPTDGRSAVEMMRRMKSNPSVPKHVPWS